MAGGPSSSMPATLRQEGPLVPLPTQRNEGFAIDYSALIGTLVKRRLLILGIVLAAVVLAVVYTLVATPLFQSTATIEIAEAPVQVVEVGRVEDGASASSQFFTTQLGLLRSATLAERTAREVNRKAGNRSNPVTSGQIRGGLTVAPDPNSRLVKVSFVSKSPRDAALVPNSLTRNFIASNIERRYATTAFARKFLENRIATVKARLESSERQLVAYAQKEQIVNLGGGSGDNAGTSLTNSSLAQINSSLAAAQAERIAAQQDYAQARTRATQKANADSTVQSLRSQRIQLEADYQDKLSIYKADYPSQVRLRERIAGLDQSIAKATALVISGTIADAKATYLAAVGRERELQAKVSSLKASELDLRGRSIDYNILQRDLDTNRVLYDGLLQRYKEVGVAAGIGDNLISVVDPAKVPSRPFTPNLLLNLAIAVLGGLTAGIACAFALDLVSDRLTTPEDVEKRLNLPLLGVVPEVKRPTTFLDAINTVRSSASEAYVSLRTTLQYSSAKGLPRTLLVTSAQPAEGKSSTSYALSLGFARLGRRTLLIDADMRNPSLGAKGRERLGFSDLLTGNDDYAGAIHGLGPENLYLIASGLLPPAPAELLGAQRLRDVLDHLSDMFDIVVIDAPPVLGLADAPLLAAYCQATLVVTRANGARRQVITSAIRRLEATGAHILGVVMTRYKSTYSGYGDAYGYGYSYEADNKSDDRTLLIDESID